MDVRAAQRDVREAHLNGAPGLLVSGLLWLVVAVLAVRGRERAAMVGLFVGGMFIYPLGTMVTRLAGGSARLASGNPFLSLALQSAFIVPLGWPLVVAAGMAQPSWYFPAASLLVGVHYLPFVTLYGMRLYGVLAAALIGVAWISIRLAPGDMAFAAWATAVVEVVGAAVAFRLRRIASPLPTGA